MFNHTGPIDPRYSECIPDRPDNTSRTRTRSRTYRMSSGRLPCRSEFYVTFFIVSSHLPGYYLQARLHEQTQPRFSVQRHQSGRAKSRHDRSKFNFESYCSDIFVFYAIIFSIHSHISDCFLSKIPILSYFLSDFIFPTWSSVSVCMERTW